MELVLRGLTWEKCLCYLDDVIVFGKTFEEALQNHRIIFQRLRNANLKLKPSRCSLFQTECRFLGHIVSEAGISCDPTKLESVQSWPVPTNVSEVRSFLGLVGYYRRFIKDFSTVAYPLTELTHKSKSFIWTEACQIAYETLKSSLISDNILAYPIENGDFILDTDASLHGIGAVLSQVQCGEEKVIAYASRTLNKSQQRYCTTYRELLAVVTFIKQFRHYLWGHTFTVRSDYSSLKWIKNFKNPEGMIARWLSVLSTYDFTIEYRRGPFHTNADALSRKPHRTCKNPDCFDCVLPPISFSKVLDTIPVHQDDVLINSKGTIMPVVNQTDTDLNDNTSCIADNGEDTYDSDLLQGFWVQSWSNSQIRQWQVQDSSICRLIDLKSRYGKQPPREVVVRDSKDTKCLWSLWDQLLVEDNILKYKWYNTASDTFQNVLVAPTELRKEIFHKLHCDKSAGHFGIRRTIELVRRRFYWPGMSSHIRR